MPMPSCNIIKIFKYFSTISFSIFHIHLASISFDSRFHRHEEEKQREIHMTRLPNFF